MKNPKGIHLETEKQLIGKQPLIYLYQLLKHGAMASNLYLKTNVGTRCFDKNVKVQEFVPTKASYLHFNLCIKHIHVIFCFLNFYDIRFDNN